MIKRQSKQQLAKKAITCLKEDTRRQVHECERQIDQMVYKLYGLTKEEIKVVEGFNKA